MNVAAQLTWRISGLLIFAFGLFLHALTTSTPASAEINANLDSTVIESAVETASIGEAQQQLIPFTEGGVGVDLLQGVESDQVIISTSTDRVEFTESRLSNPERIVIDITNQLSRISRTANTSGANYVSKVRLGAHPEKSRIVLDINKPGVNYKVREVAGTLAVTLSEEMDHAPKAAMDWEQENNAAPKEEFPETPSAGDTNIDDSIAAPSVQAEEIEMQRDAVAETAKGPRLSQLKIEQLDEVNNILVAEMDAAGFYTFSKTAPSEYVLTLEGATLEPQADETIIAPPGTGQIRTVRTLSQGSNVLVRIFSTPQSLLRARSKGGKIVVSAYDAESDSPRAQADLEEVADDEEEELSALLEDQPKYTGRLISLDLADTDIDNALRIIAEVSNLNIIASDDVSGKVTLRLIDVPWDQALDVILKTNGLDKVQEGNVIRIAPVEKLRAEREALRQARQAEEELEPLQVRYMRISYARASDLQPLIESILTERGTVAYDERSNQIIVKDIASGVRNSAILVAKLDLRTPQVLVETQIVEAQRDFLRDLGSEVGFTYIRSPETGNSLGNNFPNAADLSGSITPGSPVASSFPAAVDQLGGSAVSLLLGSADGTKSLDFRISAAESEGRIRVVSRPSVAVTNNTQATIKAVEKVRIKVPSGGLSVATGQGATSNAATGIATEVIEIGIVLEVTAQASPDYFVLMDLNAKSSTFGSGPAVDGIPPEVERSATSSVLVSSGQTFAMGGIYKISDQDTVAGVPFFKDIPFIGTLFRRQLVDNSDEELIFFITPRIIEGSFDDAAMKSAA